MLLACCLWGVLGQVQPPPGLSAEVKAGVQLIAGESRSDFLTGPDSSPLFNSALGSKRRVENLIVSPSGELRLRLRGQEHHLSYAPRLFLNVAKLSGRPTIYHVLRGKGIVGRPQGLRVTLTPGVTIGGLDLGGGAAASGAVFSGSTRAGAVQGVPASYLSLNLLGRAEYPLVRAWRGGLQALYAWMGSSHAPGAPSDPQGLPFSGGGLRNLQRIEGQLDASYAGPSSWRWQPQFLFGYLNFPSTQSYLSLRPSLVLDLPLGPYTQGHARLGANWAATGDLPSFYNRHETIVVAEAGAEHTFTRLGLPGLQAGARLLVGPYIDLVYGKLEPRSTLLGHVSYRLARPLTINVQGRYYTERYPGHVINAHHDKDIGMLNVALRAAFHRHVGAQVGGYGIWRHRNLTRTDQQAPGPEYFLFAGLTGNLQL